MSQWHEHPALSGPDPVLTERWADPRYLHTVGWLEGLIDRLGTRSSLIARLTPNSPRALCGGSLADDEDTPPGPPTDPFTLPPCPACATRRTTRRRPRG